MISSEAKRFAPATERNRKPIADVLRDLLPPIGTVLEIASGTGEHIVHFARKFPALIWQPSDPDPDALASIAAWTAASGLANILPPLRLDATAVWPKLEADAIICINMVHIAPWQASEGLFAGAGKLLATHAPLYLYGPFRERGVPTATSNEAFDKSLRERNPEWGLRSVDDITLLAAAHHLRASGRIAMPANNLSLIFRKAAF